MLSSSQIREGVQAGLIRVEFTAPTSPRDYVVTITNGSGRRQTTVTATRQTTAAEWGARWAQSTGAGWRLAEIAG